jgi:hypothetical protein
MDMRINPERTSSNPERNLVHCVRSYSCRIVPAGVIGPSPRYSTKRPPEGLVDRGAFGLPTQRSEKPTGFPYWKSLLPSFVSLEL